MHDNSIAGGVTVERMLQVLHVEADEEMSVYDDEYDALIVNMPDLAEGTLDKAFGIECHNYPLWGDRGWVERGLKQIGGLPYYVKGRAVAKLALTIWEARESLTAGFTMDYASTSATWEASDSVTQAQVDAACAYWFPSNDERGNEYLPQFWDECDELPAPAIIFVENEIFDLDRMKTALPGVTFDDVERIQKWLETTHVNTDIQRYVHCDQAAQQISNLLADEDNDRNLSAM